MRCIPVAAVVLLGCVLAGCSPEFNWREVRGQDTALVALLPCKPDSAARPVTLGGQALQLTVTGCEAGGATFAVSHATLADPSRANDVLAQWRLATLANIGAAAPRDTAFAPKGALPVPASVQTVAAGKRADGRPLLVSAAWFARGSEVFSAVVYASSLAPEVAETFFSGLGFEKP